MIFVYPIPMNSAKQFSLFHHGCIVLLSVALMTVHAFAAGVNYNTPSIEGDLFPLESANLSELKTENTSVVVDNSGVEPALVMNFKKGAYPNVKFPCPEGGWNLETYRGIEVKLTNTGEEKIRAALRVDNPGKHSDQPWNTDTLSLMPGETKTIHSIFGKNNGATGFPLDPTRVVGIQVFVINPKQDGQLFIGELKAYGSPSADDNKPRLSSPADRDKIVIPEAWVGERPPVEGDWIMTLDESFDYEILNSDVWSTRLTWNGPHPGDTQRYIDESISIKDGILSIKCEVNPGHQYNDPNLPVREYAAGMLSTYDKWTQCYGYFETRVKLPTARGLWPAFWTMPDRGTESGLGMWQRRTTGDFHGKGMEIDVFEHLTEWGPGRTNVATHWDGYEEDHKGWGTSHVYYGPTPDGWHVFGLLWESNKLTWYIDGIKKEVWESERITDVPAYLLLTLQMGRWATDDVDTASLPDYWEIDYVRAWQLADRLTSEASIETSSTSP